MLSILDPPPDASFSLFRMKDRGSNNGQFRATLKGCELVGYNLKASSLINETKALWKQRWAWDGFRRIFVGCLARYTRIQVGSELRWWFQDAIQCMCCWSAQKRGRLAGSNLASEEEEEGIEKEKEEKCSEVSWWLLPSLFCANSSRAHSEFLVTVTTTAAAAKWQKL